MESQFKKILHLKEKEVDAARIALEQATENLSDAKERLSLLESRANDVDIPMQGSVGMIHYNKMLKDSFRKELLALRLNVDFCQSEVNSKRANLGAMQMEYEKFKHLHAREVDKRLKALQLKESKELDEIGSQLYYAKRKIL